MPDTIKPPCDLCKAERDQLRRRTINPAGYAVRVETLTGDDVYHAYVCEEHVAHHTTEGMCMPTAKWVEAFR